MWETWVRSLTQEDPLEKGIATHFQCSCLENPMDRGAQLATVHGVKRVRHDGATNTTEITRASQVALVVKKPPAIQEMHV